MFTIHNNQQVAYQCCSTTLRLILKYRTNSVPIATGLNELLSVRLELIVSSFASESPSKKARDHEVFFSPKILDELIEHLDTALAYLLTEVIQSNRPKELQDTLCLIEQLSRANQASAQNFIHLLFITCANVESKEKRFLHLHLHTAAF